MKLRARTLGALAALGLVGALSVPAVTASASTPAAATYTYDAAGRLATVTNASGEVATYHYDQAGNITSITYGSGASPRLSTARRQDHPSIASVRPASTPVGASVTIAGRGFDTDAAADVVRIGPLLAPVRRATATELVVGAPPGVGGPVTVQTPGGSATGGTVHITGAPGHRSVAPASNRHPLEAPTGVTALSGLVESATGHPLAGIRLTVADSVGAAPYRSAVTDSTGRFLVTDIKPGRHELVVDGTRATTGTSYGLYAEPVETPPGRTTVLPWITYLTALDTAHAVTIPSPTTRQVTVTDPGLPGLEVVIPAGTVIRDHYGRVVRQVSLTPLAVDRTPFPWAPDMMPQFFTMQPGDSTVFGPGLKVIYPNDAGLAPGRSVPYLTESPNWAGTGWWRYGSGHVSSDGRQILPDPGTVYREMEPGGWGTGQDGCSQDCPPPGSPNHKGDPVDVGSGLFIYGHTDLALPDVIGVSLDRSYRQLDSDVHDFGVAMSDSLNLYIDAASNGDFDLFMPDGSYIPYAPTGTTGVYQATGTPTEYAGSTLTMGTTDVDGPFTVVLKSGTTMSFSNPAFLTQVQDRFGNKLVVNRNEYNPYTNGGGQIESVTTSDGRWMQFTYSPCVQGSSSDCVTQVQDNAGRSVSYVYDTSGRLQTVTAPDGGVTTYTWAPCTSSLTCSEMLSVRDADGHTVIANTFYPTTGYVESQTQGDGGTWNYKYQLNSQNQIVSTTWTNPLGVNYTSGFDSNGYPTTQTDGAGGSNPSQTSTTYDPTTEQLTSYTDALGRTTRYTYDALGNVKSVTLLAGTSKPSTYTYTYDPAYSRVTSLKDPLGHTETYTYDDQARTVVITDPMHHSAKMQLNAAGLPVSYTDALGNTTYESYLHGEQVGYADALGNVTSTYFDGLGRPLQTTDAEGNVTTDSWTALDEQATETDPLGDTTSWGYDHDGQLVSVTDPDNHQTKLTYTTMGDLAQRVDPLGNTTKYGYDHLGDLTSVTDGNGTVDKYSYSSLDQLQESRYGVSGSSAQSTVKYSYDAAGRLTKAVDSSSGTWSYKYDGLNDVTTAGGPTGSVTYKYNADGLRTSMTVPGQAAVTYGYNAANQLDKVLQGSTQVAVAYNADGLPSSVQLPNGITQADQYDANLQTLSIDYTEGSTSVGTLAYTYTKDQQVSTESGTLASVNLPAALSNATYNADNELTAWGSTSYTYDHDGNRTGAGSSTYGWNARNQLTSVTGPIAASYAYDPFGRTAQSTVGGQTTSDIYDGAALVQQLEGSTPVANYLDTGSGQTLQTTTPAATNSTLLSDAIGSTVGLANSAGQVTTSYAYTPQGQATASGSAAGNPVLFAGTVSDGAGAYEMGLRSYDPSTGTFLSQDPAQFDSGTANLYSYVGGDPVDYVDPSGLRATRRNHRPAHLARGHGTQPDPVLANNDGFSVFMSAGGGAEPPQPGPPPGGGTQPGGRTSGGGGGGGGGACYSLNVAFILAFSYSQCVEVTDTGQTFTTQTTGWGVGTPNVSAGDSVNTWTGDGPNSLGGSGTECDGSVGPVSGSYSWGSGYNEESIGGSVGPAPASFDCEVTSTSVTDS